MYRLTGEVSTLLGTGLFQCTDTQLYRLRLKDIICMVFLTNNVLANTKEIPLSSLMAH